MHRPDSVPPSRPRAFRPLGRRLLRFGPLGRRLLRFGPLGLSALCLVAGLAAGCSDAQKKISGGSPSDVLIYDILGQERPTSYYYGLVRDSHDAERFCYRCTDDPFLVDKSIHAVNKLGDAPFARLEGQAVVVGKLTEVLLEDPSALAQASAANALTKIAVKLPAYPQRGAEETGPRFVRLLGELDGLHNEQGARRAGEDASRRLAQIVTEIGDMRITDLVLAKQSIRPFHNRAFLVDEADPELRAAIDTALTKRLGALIRVALEAAVPAESPWVRADAIRGLKVLRDADAFSTIVQQMSVEPNWQVRAEAVEYMGRIGNADAVEALVPLLADADPSVRHKAHEGLRRIAGRDLGRRERPWTRWARRTYPALADLGADDAEPVADTARSAFDSTDMTPPDSSAPAPGPGTAPAPVPSAPTPALPPVLPAASDPGPSVSTAPLPRAPAAELPAPIVRRLGGPPAPGGAPVRSSLRSPPPPPPPGSTVRRGPVPPPTRLRSIPPPPPPPNVPVRSR